MRQRATVNTVQKTDGRKPHTRPTSKGQPANNQREAARQPSRRAYTRPAAFLCPEGGEPVAKGSITMRVENLQKLLDQVQEIDEKGRKAVKATVRDVKSRAPSWIAQEVTQVYNIKKSEITPSSGKGAKPKKMAGSIQVRGETIEEMTITYSGRLLTPVHFGMTPKTPPAGKSYTLKMQVVKGQKKVIGRYKNTRTPGGPYSERSHNILMGTGNTKADGVGYIPFQRMMFAKFNLNLVSNG